MPRRSPRVTVLLALMKALEEGDLPTVLELPDLKLRWARNRYTMREERPCIALAFVSDGPQGEAGDRNGDELVRSLSFDIIVDLEVETEASAEAQASMGTSVLDFDPTGLSDLSWVLDVAMLALRRCFMDEFRDTTELGKVADWIEDVIIDDDEDLPDDDGRLVGRANVIYRTSSWDPTLLFARD